MGGYPDDELHGVNPDPAYWDRVLILANLSNVGNVCREILRTVDDVRSDFDRSNPAAMEESARSIWGLVNELDELVGALTGKANLSSRHIDQVSTMARRTVKALEFWRLVGNSDVSGLSGKEARVVRECEEDVAPLDRDERQTLMRNVTADIEDAEKGLPFALEETDQGIQELRDKTVSQPPGARESAPDTRGGNGKQAAPTSKGVSLLDIALRIRPGNKDGQKRLIKQWQSSRTVKLPEPIGQDAKHSQRNLYEPASILEFIKKIEGPEAVRDFGLMDYVYDVSRSPGQD